MKKILTHYEQCINKTAFEQDHHCDGKTQPDRKLWKHGCD